MMKFAALLLLSFTCSAFAASNLPVPPDYRFKIEVLTENIPQPMELELAPDGRIFFNEIGGKLKIYKPQNHEVVLSGSIPVFPEQETGSLVSGFVRPFKRTSGFISTIRPPILPA